MKKVFRDIFRLLRPRQWIKNFALYASLLFSGELFNLWSFLDVSYGFLVFCAISSAIYVINDIFDAKKDRLHPFKKYRPLANKDVSIRTAIVIVILLTLLSFVGSFLINQSFFVITVIYFILHVGYSAYLKHIEIVDTLTLAGGYMLRVLAGEVITGFHLSAWLFLTVISLSLFLAIGKRRSELTLLGNHAKGQLITTRKTLSHYSEKLLDVYLSLFATSTFISYSLFTFVANPEGMPTGFEVLFNDFLGDRKWLMLTILPVVYGLMRYLQRIYENHEGESPERVLLSDRPLLLTVVIYTVLVVTIIYFIR